MLPPIKQERLEHGYLRDRSSIDPLIGNLLNFPKERWDETFAQWQKEYSIHIHMHVVMNMEGLLTRTNVGDVVFVNLNIAGVSMLIVNSLEITEELLVRRSKIYSGRAYKPRINEL